MKKNTKLIIGAIVIFVVGYFIGDATAISRVKKQIGQGTEKQVSSAKEEVKEEKKDIKFGEQSAVGNLGVKILEAKESTAISNEAGKSTPSGKFIIINLEIKNNGEEATEYSPRDFKLKHDKKTYEIDDNSFEALGNLNSQEKIYNKNEKFIGSYDKFNSGISKNTFAVFDVPKEAKIEDLKLITKHNKGIQFNLK
ncbi:DUF4352 domain-containing protein [Clostridium botulinum]|uniref:DUF4352 domain-containing protein n=1 Tax=Clostridium botulinum TaxID=1491 RepID=UPI00015920AE|nr:DUF4352 domain-containing protein [Clostridium botulinum]ABS34895.1 hypothetical protein CLB_2941 [Clostridium botulinum A str. ATCC 19397]MBO3438183.1 DUF4352 domain-containing protein [Clostridium botulinum]NFH04145.1 DUF4352 domain-containing protein [Clostridium botulinum]NFH88103.1 DUF4352 domain-containing protein [Clostridium botulinum]NFJ74842.1 DUF4352 domain-containing protein [Clostridium botulinum]